MKLNQLIAGSAFVAIAAFSIVQAPEAIARTVTVTRGPNGAAFVVKAEKIPADAEILTYSKSTQDSKISRQGVGGVEQSKTSRLIQRGPNGAFFPSNK